MEKNRATFIDERIVEEGEFFRELSESSNTTVFLGLFNGEKFL